MSKESIVRDFWGNPTHVRVTSDDGKTSILHEYDGGLWASLFGDHKGGAVEVADHRPDGTTKAYCFDGGLLAFIFGNHRGDAKGSVSKPAQSASPSYPDTSDSENFSKRSDDSTPVDGNTTSGENRDIDDRCDNCECCDDSDDDCISCKCRGCGVADGECEESGCPCYGCIGECTDCICYQCNEGHTCNECEVVMGNSNKANNATYVEAQRPVIERTTCSQHNKEAVTVIITWIPPDWEQSIICENSNHCAKCALKNSSGRKSGGGFGGGGGDRQW